MYGNRSRRWPKGTWMRLISAGRLRAFVGPEPGKKMSARRLALRVINPETGRPISASFIDHLLAGRKTSCTPKVAERIAEALEVPIDILFDPRAPSGARPVTKQRAA